VGVQPAGDVERLQPGGEFVPERLDEGAEEVPVVLERVGGVVLLGEVEKQRTQLRRAELVLRREFLQVGTHQPIEGVPGGLLGFFFRAFGEPDLAAVELDVPGVLRRAVPGFGPMRHQSKPPVRKHG
jgi:hypothetical protein